MPPHSPAPKESGTWAAADSADRVVFVVDDDEAVLQSLRFSLEVDGYDVRLFRSGSELMAVGSFPQSGCLVLDFRLPGSDGLETLATLRRRGVRLPAVLITSNPPAALRDRAAAAGVAIVEKPQLGSALGEAIQHALAAPP